MTAHAVLAAQADEVARLLFGLLRSRQERAAVAGRAAEVMRIKGRIKLADELERDLTNTEKMPSWCANFCGGTAATAPITIEQPRPGSSDEQ
jgi:hypothetical protein